VPLPQHKYPLRLPPIAKIVKEHMPCFAIDVTWMDSFIRSFVHGTDNALAWKRDCSTAQDIYLIFSL
jgi:hypothetical protein